MKAFTSIGVFVVAVPVVLLLGVPLALWAAYVATILWGWFVTPLFGLPVPSLWAMFGLLILVRLPFVKTDTSANEEKSLSTLGIKLLTLMFAPAFALLFGWFATLFI